MGLISNRDAHGARVAPSVASSRENVNGWALDTGFGPFICKYALWHMQFIHFTQFHAIYISHYVSKKRQ